MKNVTSKLRGGDRRSIGRSNEIAKQISASAKLFAQVFGELAHADPVIRMRAADAIEKASALNPKLIQPYKRDILNRVAVIPQQEVRWHVAQIIPRLQLKPRDRDNAVSILFDYLDDKSSIVKTFAMQALADLAERDSLLRKRVLPVIEFLAASGSPAMRARGRKLVTILKR
jgi:hypothetical protein